MQPTDQYIRTSKLCEKYDVEKKYFLTRIKNGVFKINEHFIKQENTIRWNVKAVHEWWFGKEKKLSNPAIDNILDKILDKNLLAG
ncbi:MAG: hypothetical protein U9N42_07735 [Campylobacterota bacterium]|nr:hypothetical protein [Campylobacterota bacterium]